MKKVVLNIFMSIVTVLLFSCNTKSKEKELELKEKELEIREKELLLKSKDTASINQSNRNDNSVNKKTMTMTFEEYSEGDFLHFIFRDNSSKEAYDFRYLSENKLTSIPLLLEDDNSIFGYKANPKYINKQFIIEAEEKDVLDADLEGNTITTKGWVINNIKQVATENSTNINYSTTGIITSLEYQGNNYLSIY